MKKYLISSMVILLVLGLVYPLSAQPAGGRGGGMGGGARTGGRGGRNTEAQQAAIEAIEAQLAKLKENIEAQAAMPRMGRGGDAGGETLSQEEMDKMREQRTTLREEQQTAIAAIDDQVMVLKGNQLQTEHEAEVAELQAIADSATKEKATATVKLVQDLIAKRTAALESVAERLGIRLRSGRGRQGGGGFGGQGGGGFGGGQGGRRGGNQ